VSGAIETSTKIWGGFDGLWWIITSIKTVRLQGVQWWINVT
jgi:hypothetical protein